MRLWRISKHGDLSGRGGLLVDGRWHRKGTQVVYCCDHPSTALLEILVHMDKSRIPADFQLLGLDCPEDLNVFNGIGTPTSGLSPREAEMAEQIAKGYAADKIAANLGLSRLTVDGYLRALSGKPTDTLSPKDMLLFAGMMNAPSISLDVSQVLGTALLQECRFPLIRVRSAVMPAAWNYLLNPLHPDAATIVVAESIRYPFDSRLLL